MPESGSKTAPSTGSRRLAARDLVGRADELQMLLAAIRDPPSVVQIEGEAEVGKSRLLSELFAREELADHLKLIGHCHPILDPFPLGPVVEALRGLRDHPKEDLQLGAVTGTLRPLIPELSEHLPPELAPLDDRSAERHRLFRALVEVLEALGPTVLALEDLQWTDPSTAEFLTFLGSDLPAGLCVVLTHRQEDLSDSYWRGAMRSSLPAEVARIDIALGCFGRGGIRSLIEAILDTEMVSDDFVSFIHEKTSGLPFAVEEVLRLLQEREDLVQANGAWARRRLERITVPPAIQGPILERAGRLSPDARRVLDATACIGQGVTEDLLAVVAELDPSTTRMALIESLHSGLIAAQPDGSYAFRHALAEQAINDALPVPERRDLHMRAARALEEGHDRGLSGRIADHYFRAQWSDKWVEFAEIAADVAASLHDDVTAFRYLSQVLATEGISSDIRTRLAIKLGRTALDGRMHVGGIPLVEQHLRTMSLEPDAEGELRFLYAALLAQGGSESECRDQCVVVAELGRPPRQAARCMSMLSISAVQENDFSTHLRWSDRALAAANSLSDPVLALIVKADRASLLVNTGEAEGFSLADELAAVPSGTSEKQEWIRACLNLGQASFYLGRYERASGFVARGLVTGQQMGYTRWQGALEATQLLIDCARGRWEGLQARAGDVRASNSEVPDVTIDADLVLMWLALARGELGKARSLGKSIVESAPLAGSIAAAAAAAGALVSVELARGRTSSAVDVGMIGLELIRTKQIWTWAGELVPPLTQALLEDGRVDEATALVNDFALGVADRDAPDPAAALSYAQGLIERSSGSFEGASARFTAAASVWETLPKPLHAAMAYERLGECCQDEIDAAVQGLLKAQSIYKSLDVPTCLARVTKSLKSLGGMKSHGGRTGYGDALSPREEEIVDLIAAGKTDAEIAAELFISPWTVKHHVSSALVTCTWEGPSGNTLGDGWARPHGLFPE